MYDMPILHFSSAAKAAPSVCIGIGRALQIRVLFNQMGSNVILVLMEDKVSWYIGHWYVLLPIDQLTFYILPYQ